MNMKLNNIDIKQYMLPVPELILEKGEIEYFTELYYRLNPINTPETLPWWRVNNIPRAELDFNLAFFNKLKQFCEKMKLQVAGLSFQIMWAGSSKQLFIHKDSPGSGKYLIPFRLSWHLIGPKLPLKWYKEILEDPGYYVTNGKYGAWTVNNQQRFEEEAKVLEIVPDYPCLLNTHLWHTIAQDKVVDDGLRVILTAAFKPDAIITDAELWNSVRSKLDI